MNEAGKRNIFQLPSVAGEYDDYYHSEKGKIIDKIEKEIVSYHLRNLSGNHLLELGCGTGHWTQFFVELGFQVTALDNSEAMLEIARGKNIQNVQFLMADAGRLPFPDNHFAVIVSVTMLEFVEDIERVLEEIDRVLQPGGTFLLGCLNALSELGKNRANDAVFRYGRFFTPEEISKLLSRFGRPAISAGVYFSPGLEILDGTEKQETVQPAFIVASVKK
jgi:ubiquinone/menaquinone biosynthesis C-methylase UbiE